MNAASGPGLEYLRRLSEHETALLVRSLRAVRPHMSGSTDEIFWLNLFVDGRFTVDHPDRDRLHGYVCELVEMQYPAPPRQHIISYGFLCNPPGSSTFQQFHYDYTETSSNLFIPMTRVTLKNATQFSRQQLRSKMDINNNFGDCQDILDKEGLDYLEFIQIACKPYCLFKMHPATVHRGIANQDDYERIMFWVTVDTLQYEIGETQQYTASIGNLETS